MKISTVKQTIKLCREAEITAMIWGHSGLGKSQVAYQVACENQWGFLDFRLSQIEASDLRGLPDKREGRTVYLPPVDMPVADMEWEEYEKLVKAAPEAERRSIAKKLQPRLKKGILFLDEINRSADDVCQCSFQLVLDRCIGQYVLPPGWSILCAGNYMEGYMVNGFTDPAFLNRFCHLIFSGGETTVEEWVNYMANCHGSSASKVIEFATQNTKHLDGDRPGDLGFSIMPSRRSWEAVVRVLDACGKGQYSKEAQKEVIAGLIGRELGIEYDNYDCPVKPRELLDNGVEAMRPKLAMLERNNVIGLTWGLVSYIKGRIEEDKIAIVAMDYAEWLCKTRDARDMTVAFIKSLIKGNSEYDGLRTAAISNPQLAKLLVGGKGEKKNFLNRISQRPDLQSLISTTVWGKD
jgi:alkaline phosphatase D